ncbi:hypothetical protein GLOIN_2v1488490 [Rhizophagus irregularis DAOM 181602=DAOM 197198]|uniref:Uncharacterized protein n=1 Tax=Rhizophagus irregularis (strain DAOM 181602 / DAOM 197198 / MUCL 43194) TaxID=747089 RepID=A0A2P4NZK4_RHIID|nr:hypothetical protein GLOIN_2v1488490 [Rhizophagus irregularis DAOM 181602=DAOM 197198]POG58570.1 hypothetical protein GLOIN_2v1488490 [Rhizophagus irregularis DAOM 181602=DAOM 197198]|eukprot:XP_025165436.1 hypothetical protein GLOIN_2v1488490 [Rhizophagus irregularis DAOM 181602=DAOM 197198]
MRPEYVPPSRELLSGRFLNQKTARINKKIKKIIEDFENLTLAIDGWTNKLITYYNEVYGKKMDVEFSFMSNLISQGLQNDSFWIEPIKDIGIRRFQIEPIKDIGIQSFQIEPIKDIGIQRFWMEPIDDFEIWRFWMKSIKDFRIWRYAYL